VRYFLDLGGNTPLSSDKLLGRLSFLCENDLSEVDVLHMFVSDNLCFRDCSIGGLEYLGGVAVSSTLLLITRRTFGKPAVKFIVLHSPFLRSVSQS
jgi:hypothetical protein